MDFFLLNKSQVESTKNNSQAESKSKRDATFKTPPMLDHNDTRMNDSLLRRGHFIKMIYKPNGQYNMYKGYIGEIRDYRRGQDYAMIILHAMVNLKVMRVPIDHFVKIDY